MCTTKFGEFFGRAVEPSVSPPFGGKSSALFAAWDAAGRRLWAGAISNGNAECGSRKLTSRQIADPIPEKVRDSRIRVQDCDQKREEFAERLAVCLRPRAQYFRGLAALANRQTRRTLITDDQRAIDVAKDRDRERSAGRASSRQADVSACASALPIEEQRAASRIAQGTGTGV